MSVAAIREGLHRVPLPPVDENVRQLQRLLNRQGAKLETDGRFGQNTEAALARFQASKRLTPTGYVDARTVAALVDTYQGSSPAPTAQVTGSYPKSALARTKAPLSATTPDRQPTVPYTTVGDSIVVGIDAQYRARSVFKRLDFHQKIDPTTKHPEMVGKTTRYIAGRLKNEVIPQAKAAGIRTVVIGGGTNDILYAMKTDAEADRVYRDVTTRIAANVAAARAAGLQVISLGLPPEAQFIERAPQFRDAATKARAHALWTRVNAFILAQAKDADGPTAVVDVASLLGEKHSGSLRYRDEFRQTGDMLHPTISGSKAVARQIEKTLLSLERT